MKWSIQNYYDYCISYSHTFKIGLRQLKPKRCLCDFGELPKLIRATVYIYNHIFSESAMRKVIE